ncbi:MAG: WecB/TagA/CpsF family glycosyltransferase [Pseudomonadota bacterium]
MTVWTQPVEHKNILGVEVADYGEREAIDFVSACIEHGRYQPVSFLNANNANIAWERHDAADAFAKNVVLSDGIGVDIAAKTLTGSAFRANLNGTDLIPTLLREARTPLKVGLFGGKPGVADSAANVFRTVDDRHAYRVISHGYVNADDEVAILKQLRDWQPDILLVALGVPRQEIWVAQNLDENHCTVPISVGALFDLVSGEVRRAPAWVQWIRSEWAYRLAVEPRRLWKRYILGNPIFLWRALHQRLGAQPPWKGQ